MVLFTAVIVVGTPVGAGASTGTTVGGTTVGGTTAGGTTAGAALQATGMTVDPTTHRIYLATNAGVPSVIVIDVSGRTSASVIATIPLGAGREAGGIALDSAARRLYVGSDSGTEDGILTIDTVTNQVTSGVDIGPLDPQRPAPIPLLVNPVSHKLYAAFGLNSLAVLAGGPTPSLLGTAVIGFLPHGVLPVTVNSATGNVYTIAGTINQPSTSLLEITGQ